MPDLDLPLQPSAEQIRRREFATIRRGYDTDQVRDFLLAVGDSVEALEGDLRKAKNGAGSPAAHVPAVATGLPPAAPGPDPYEALGKRFAGLLGTADKEAQRLVTEAKAESTRILSQARTEAERIRVNAQTRAEEARAESLQLLEKARTEAERALTGLSSRRETLLDQLQTMQSRLLSAAEDLAIVIEKPDEASPLPPVATTPKPAADVPAPPAAATPKASAPAEASEEAQEADIVDPRYEDLWVSSDEDAVDIPDLASIELDFDEEQPSAER
jgi:DivIVA domain-containing protein